ncbi:unnamed protein product [Trichogramma brassicae]|uniref:Uncharacterized protein n=1 Tax=Trichogramma brassicae TaxID=86971 RepID=A0A6H5IFJ0_9HYME|nr:unnamed protein product [Trichogramma brassicae]
MQKSKSSSESKKTTFFQRRRTKSLNPLAYLPPRTCIFMSCAYMRLCFYIVLCLRPIAELQRPDLSAPNCRNTPATAAAVVPAPEQIHNANTIKDTYIHTSCAYKCIRSSAHSLTHVLFHQKAAAHPATWRRMKFLLARGIYSRPTTRTAAASSTPAVSRELLHKEGRLCRGHKFHQRELLRYICVYVSAAARPAREKLYDLELLYEKKKKKKKKRKKKLSRCRRDREKRRMKYEPTHTSSSSAAAAAAAAAELLAGLAYVYGLRKVSKLPLRYNDKSDDFYRGGVRVDGSNYSQSVSSVKKLIKLRSRTNWQIEKERYELLKEIYPLIEKWKGSYPDLRDVFRNDQEIEWLLEESVKSVRNSSTSNRAKSLINFVNKTGYRAPLGCPGKPRTTALHHAARLQNHNLVKSLFQIYSRFHSEYVSEWGSTHFLVACDYGFTDIVERFLDVRSDWPGNPNRVAPETGDSPLHLLLRHGNRRATELLLAKGADPNLPNKDGSTPLHVLGKSAGYDDVDLVRMLFELSSDRYKPLRVDARDKLGNTPLHYALKNGFPMVAEFLLRNGAVRIWPTIWDRPRCTSSARGTRTTTWRPSSSRSATTSGSGCGSMNGTRWTGHRCSGPRGYRMKRIDALTIMRLFHFRGLLETSAVPYKYWNDEEKFAARAKKIMIGSSLSLHDSIRSPPEELAKLLLHTKYYAGFSAEWWELSEKPRKHLCEKLSQGFFRKWALKSLVELMRDRLPILCCDMIVKKLMNKDLFITYIIFTTIMDCLLVSNQIRFFSKFFLALVTSVILETFMDRPLVEEQMHFLSKFLLTLVTISHAKSFRPSCIVFWWCSAAQSQAGGMRRCTFYNTFYMPRCAPDRHSRRYNKKCCSSRRATSNPNRGYIVSFVVH